MLALIKSHPKKKNNDHWRLWLNSSTLAYIRVLLFPQLLLHNIFFSLILLCFFLSQNDYKKYLMHFGFVLLLLLNHVVSPSHTLFFFSHKNITMITNDVCQLGDDARPYIYYGLYILFTIIDNKYKYTIYECILTYGYIYVCTCKTHPPTSFSFIAISCCCFFLVPFFG